VRDFPLASVHWLEVFSNEWHWLWVAWSSYDKFSFFREVS